MKTQKGDIVDIFFMTLLAVMLLVLSGLVTVMIISIIPDGVEREYKCKAGYKFTNNGKQIIGENGGGLPCTNKPTKTEQDK